MGEDEGTHLHNCTIFLAEIFYPVLVGITSTERYALCKIAHRSQRGPIGDLSVTRQGSMRLEAFINEEKKKETG